MSWIAFVNQAFEHFYRFIRKIIEIPFLMRSSDVSKPDHIKQKALNMDQLQNDYNRIEELKHRLEESLLERQHLSEKHTKLKNRTRSRKNKERVIIDDDIDELLEQQRALEMQADEILKQSDLMLAKIHN